MKERLDVLLVKRSLWRIKTLQTSFFVENLSDLLPF